MLRGKVMVTVAAILVALALGFGVMLSMQPHTPADVLQAEMMRIATQLHAPGDTTTQTVATSTVLAGYQMRMEILRRLEEGATPQAVLATLEQEYGPTVLANPAPSGFGLVVWVLPIGGVLLAALAAAWVIRKRLAVQTDDPVHTGAEQAIEDTGTDGWRTYV